MRIGNWHDITVQLPSLRTRVFFLSGILASFDGHDESGLYILGFCMIVTVLVGPAIQYLLHQPGSQTIYIRLQ